MPLLFVASSAPAEQASMLEGPTKRTMNTSGKQPSGTALRRNVGVASAALWDFKQAVAERLGLNVTDLRCLELILQVDAGDHPGSVTPGRLAQDVGLTTGAITGALDRLERSGLIQREHDAEDRRRIIVRCNQDKVSIALQTLLNQLDEAFAALRSRFRDDELDLTSRVLQEVDHLLRRATHRVRQGTANREILAGFEIYRAPEIPPIKEVSQEAESI